MNEKTTVGAKALELQKKTDEKINPIDLQRAVHKGNDSNDSYENQVRVAVERGRDLFEGDFFVVVLFKKERLFVNCVRQYFLPRKSCPRPEYDQVVYQYLSEGDDLKFIWVIPDKESCEAVPTHLNDMPSDYKEFVNYIMDFNSGKLDLLSEKINYNLNLI